MKRIRILQDQDPESPREWDNVGTIVTWHRRYNIGDEQPRLEPDEWLKELAWPIMEKDVVYMDKLEKRWAEWYEMESGDSADTDELMEFVEDAEVMEFVEREYIIMPVYLYDHSGISISTSSFIGRAQHAEWDSGQIGYIYVSKEDARAEWNGSCLEFMDNPEAHIETRAIKYLEGEIETYDDYLRGNVYGYILEELVEDGDPEDKNDWEEIESCWGFYGDNYKEDMKGNFDAEEQKLLEEAEVEY
jgi:hypothetical protein